MPRAARLANRSSGGASPLLNVNKIAGEGIARDAFAFGAHVVSAQFPQGVSHEFCGDFFAPAHVEIRVVQRLGDSGGESGSLGNSFAVERTAFEKIPRLGSDQRLRRGRTYDNPGIIHVTLRGNANGRGDG